MILAWPMLANAKPYNHWRPTKVETTGALRDYETLISRLFETILDFKTKNQVVPRHVDTAKKGALAYNGKFRTNSK